MCSTAIAASPGTRDYPPGAASAILRTRRARCWFALRFHCCELELLGERFRSRQRIASLNRLRQNGTPRAFWHQCRNQFPNQYFLVRKSFALQTYPHSLLTAGEVAAYERL